MQIDAVEVFHVRLPTETVLVRLGSGVVSGWGEACAGAEPVDSPEWSGGVFACLRDFLAPAVRGQSILSGEQLQGLLAQFQGNSHAKSALDMAWWNLRSRTHATSLKTMLGGTRETIETSISLDVMPTADDLLREIETQHAVHDLIILKFRPGWDEQMLRHVRQEFPAIPLAIDCDACCHLGQREMFYRLDDFTLRWIEQPLPADDLVAHAMLQESIRTPICLHQAITSLHRAEQATDLQSCRAIKIDPSLIGGLTPALAIHNDCVAAGIPMAVGGRYATSIGANAFGELAKLSGVTMPCELPPPNVDLGGSAEPEIASFERAIVNRSFV